MKLETRLSRLERGLKKNADRLPFCPVCMDPRIENLHLEWVEIVEMYRRSGIPREGWPAGIRGSEPHLLADGRLKDGQAFPKLDQLQLMADASAEICRRAQWRRCPGCGELNVWRMSVEEIVAMLEKSDRPPETWPPAVREFMDRIKADGLGDGEVATTARRRRKRPARKEA